MELEVQAGFRRLSAAAAIIAPVERGLHYEVRGGGDTLLLVHGTGSSLRVWEPVVDMLAASRTVISVDLPGFGSSASLGASGPPPTPAGFARVLSGLLRDLGHDTAHIAGNSVGGWTALEMARLGAARSVVALSPAGLWAWRVPLYDVLSLRGTRLFTRLLDPLMPALLGRDHVRRIPGAPYEERPREPQKPPGDSLPQARVRAVRGVHPGEPAPVARGGELGDPPLEPRAVVAKAVGRADHDEFSHQIRPVEGELQREGSSSRDAEHVDRRAEAVPRVALGEVGHGCSSLQPDLPPYPVHSERTREGGEQPQLSPTLDAGGVGVGHPEAGEHDQRRTMAERQVRQPASELSFHYFIGHGFTLRRGGTVWDPGGPYSEHVSNLRVSVRRTRENSLAVTTSASTGLLG